MKSKFPLLENKTYDFLSHTQYLLSVYILFIYYFYILTLWIFTDPMSLCFFNCIKLPVISGFPGGSDGEESASPGGASGKNPLASAGDVRDVGLIPGLGRSLEGGHGNPFQWSCLENPMDRGAWQAAVLKVAQSDTSDLAHTYHKSFQFYVHIWMIFFSKFAKLYNHHNNPVLKHFHHPSEILHTLLQLLDITTPGLWQPLTYLLLP